MTTHRLEVQALMTNNSHCCPGSLSRHYYTKQFFVVFQMDRGIVAWGLFTSHILRKVKR